MNETSSTARSGWHTPNCGRGTAQLIYSCLTTIFLCTWTVFHDEVYRGNRTYRRMWWMLVAIFTPEIVMLRALRQYIEARDLTEKMLLQRHWSVEHSWLTNMGGIKLVWVDPMILEAGEIDRYITHTTSGFGEFSERLADDNSPPATASQLFWLSQRKKLDIDAFPRKEEIHDKSKSSYLLKGMACFEGIFLLVLLIARTAQSLPISTLEISTLSYVACSFVTYGLWWYKPHDIAMPIRLPCKMLNEDEAESYKKVENVMADSHSPPVSIGFWNLYELMTRYPAYQNPTFKNGMLAISTVFGGIHLAAWNDSLPTEAESWLFRICSFLSTVTAPAFFYIIRSYGYFNMCPSSFFGRLRTYSTYGVAGLYLLVRLTLTVEPFVALRSVPVGVYEQVQWASFMPQIL